MGRALRYLSSLLILLPALAFGQSTAMKTITDSDCATESCSAASAAQYCKQTSNPKGLYQCKTSTGFYIPVTSGGVKVKEVCASGCEFTVICGATCSSSSSDCAAGSAIKTIKDAADFSETNRYEVLVRPGTYNECVTIFEMTDIDLRIEEGARIVPTVTVASDVSGGVVRIGTKDAPATRTERIRVFSSGYVRNDAVSAPEAALVIGPEACGGTADWDDIYIDGGIWIGNHDAIHVCGDKTASNTQTAIPRIVIRGVTAISGADTFVKKSASDLILRDSYLHSWSNYCETTTTDITDAESGTVNATGASTTTFTLDADANATDNAYVGRHIRLTAGTCAAGFDAWITDYTTARLVTVEPALSITPDATCSYAIAAVPNAAESPCNEVDWTTLRADSGNGGYWKATGFHFGINPTQGTAPDRDMTRVFDTNIEVDVNDFGPDDATTCSGQQAMVSGILAYTAVRHQNAIFDNVNIRIKNNVILRSSGAQADNLCAYPFAGVNLPITVFEGEAVYSGNIRVENTTDPLATVYGIATAQTSASTLKVPRAHIEVVNSVGSYTGTTKTLIQASSAVLSIGDVSSNATVTSTGTITQMSSARSREVCAVIADLASTDDSFEFWMANQAATITSVGCRCRGTCTTAATFTLEDRAGNAMTITGTNPTCATSGNATYAAVTAANALVVGEGIAFDVTNTPNPDGSDEYTLCVTYTSD